MNQPLIGGAGNVSTLQSFSEHAHACHEIIFVREGQLDVCVGDRRYEASSPCLIFISKLEPHALHPRSGIYRRDYISIDPAAVTGRIGNDILITLLSNRPEGFSHVLDVSDCLEEVAALFDNMIAETRASRPFSAELQASLLGALLILIYRRAPALFSRENEKSISVIWQIQCEMEAHYEMDFSLDELAARYHISRYYLSHQFKKITGVPLMQYLTMCRLSAARTLLVETDRSVTDILHAVGFSDGSNFSRLFKSKIGQTPQEYRAIARGERSE